MPGRGLAINVQNEAATQAVVERFNEAFNRQDLDATMAVMTDDCVFENTFPPPDGERFEGRQAVRTAFEGFFDSSPNARFETEDVFATGDRCVVLWTYRWVGESGERGHVRGVDVFQVRRGLVASKKAYVKG